MEKVYTHLCRAERDEINRLVEGGLSRREIAKRMARSASTISRELKRNREAIGYLPDTAHRSAHRRRRRGDFKIDRYPALKSVLLEGLYRRWSPAQIAALCHGERRVCAETIYRYIYRSPFAIKFQLYQCLWRERPRRRPRKGRTSRYLVIISNPDGKHARPVAERLAHALAHFAPKSITLDNGGEFAKHETLPAKTFFCAPYSSWQKRLRRKRQWTYPQIPAKKLRWAYQR